MVSISLKKIIIAVIVLFFISSNANASLYVGGGVGASEGAILEAGYKMNPFISIRGRGGYLPSTNIPTSLIGSKFETSGNTPFGNIDSIKLKSQTFDLGLEVTPVPLVPILSKFKIIGAVQYMNLQMNLSANYTHSDVNASNVHYTTHGNVFATIKNKQQFAPYLALGVDLINLPFVSIRATFGATLRSFEVKSHTSSYGLSQVSYSESGSPDFSDINSREQTYIDAGINSLREKVNKTAVIPSLSLTARVTLPNLPFIPVL